MIPNLFVNYLLIVAGIIFSIPVSAQGLIINNGGNLIVHDTGKIVINNGGFANSGMFNGGSGTVAFTGSQPATISGSAITYFNTITLDKATNSFSLLQHAGANGQVKLIAGTIDLNGYNFDLGNTGQLNGESEAARIVGPNGSFLIRTANISAGNHVNPGNLGMSFTPVTDLGLTVIKRGQQSLQVNGINSIHRFYDVAAANDVSTKEDITFQYFDDELNDNIESELAVYYLKPADTSGTWQTPYAADVINNTIQITNSSFSGQYIIANNNNADSIRATPLVAEMDGFNAKLSWTTLYEKNTVRFELERSGENGNYSNINTFTAAGTSRTTLYYSYTASVDEVWNFRYKLIFQDSSFRYSNVVTVAPVVYPNVVLQVTPNPTTGPVNIKLNSINTQNVFIEVVNLAGILIERKVVNVNKGINTVSVDLSNLVAGTYYVRIFPSSAKAYKVIKINP